MRYMTKRRTMSRNKPGGGWQTGWVAEGLEFEVISMQNGWVQYAPNRWILISDCELIETTPVDPPILTTAYPKTFQIRFPDPNTTGGWLPYHTYEDITDA